MLSLDIPVTLNSVNAAGKDADFAGYAEFVFLGGQASVKLSDEQFKALSGRVGEDMVCVFGVTVKTVTLAKTWNASVFLPDRLIEIKS